MSEQSEQSEPSLRSTENLLEATDKIKYAGFFVRLAAHLFDRLLFILPLLTLGFFLPASLETLRLTVYNRKGVVGLITGGLYYSHLIIGTHFFHKTLGKHIFGLKLVYEGGQYIGWGRAVIRELFARLISDIFLLGYLYSLFNPKRQTFHDKITKIIVIQERPLNRKTKLFMKLAIIGLPLIYLAMSINIVSRYFKAKQQARDLADAVEQKIDLLKSVDKFCNVYFAQAQNLLKNYCNVENGINECKLNEVQISDLEKINKKLEDLFTECIRFQYEYEKLRRPTPLPGLPNYIEEGI